MIKQYFLEMIKFAFNSEIYQRGKDRLLLSKNADIPYHIQQIYLFLSDTEVKRVIERYEIDLVLDVGANRGQFASHLRESIGYKGQIISFEPVKDVFDISRQRSADDPRWSVYNLALAERDGERAIHISKASEFSSFLETNDYSNRFGDIASIERREKVPTRRLDTFLAEEVQDYRERKILLKMDTQGYDLQVFAGVGEAIHSIVALQSEISAIPIYQGMPHLTESITCFEKAGFGIVGLFPVSREKSLRAIEYDCLMVKLLGG